MISGNKLGQSIGFPTANIEIDDKNKLVLPFGIYAAYCTYEGERYKGMLYVGDRPVIKDDNTRTVEINLFDFSESIYGAILAIEVIEFLRPDKHLDSLDELRSQLFLDKEAAIKSLEWYEREEAVSNDIISSVGIVILNYNGLEHLKTFLPSVVEHTNSVQIYIADNNSTD
ncbi:MAG TPA: riboflavin kinase, partial [Saprospiraceae bacterium]|nr:riboflavin kinase [Saprospiraceae bacterium]